MLLAKTLSLFQKLSSVHSQLEWELPREANTCVLFERFCLLCLAQTSNKKESIFENYYHLPKVWEAFDIIASAVD